MEGSEYLFYSSILSSLFINICEKDQISGSIIDVYPFIKFLDKANNAMQCSVKLTPSVGDTEKITGVATTRI